MKEKLEAEKKQLEQEMLNYPPPPTNFKEIYSIISEYLDVREEQSKNELRLQSEFKNIYSQLFLAGGELESLSLMDEFIDSIVWEVQAQAYRKVLTIIGFPEMPYRMLYAHFMSESEIHCKRNEGLDAFRESYIKYLNNEKAEIE